MCRLHSSQLAGRVGCSLETINLWFPSRNDLLLGMAIQGLEIRVALHRRAMEYLGTTRDRMLALSVADDVFAAAWPDHDRADLIVRTAMARIQSTSRLRGRLEQLEIEALSLPLALIREAVLVGDLDLEPLFPEASLFVLYSLSLGAKIGQQTYGSIIRKLNVSHISQRADERANLVLNGMNWRPLYSSAECSEAAERIAAELSFDDLLPPKPTVVR